MKSGVRKSGWPMPRLMMSRPCAASALARASTAKAFSSPIRSKAAMVFIMAVLPAGRPARLFYGGGVHPIGRKKSIGSRGRQQVRRRLRKPRGAGQLHGADELDAEMLEHVAHAVGARHGQAPDRGPADEDGAGAERQRFQDVGAAADAAVDVGLGLVAERGGDLADRGGSRHRRVEMAAAVIGNDDGLGAMLGASDRVVGA